MGMVGLFTAGLFGLGALLGLGLGVAAIAQARRSGGGGSVAWAAVSANAFALVSIAPWLLLIVTLRPMLPELMPANPFAEPKLPRPHVPFPSFDAEPAPPPPPPPPPASRGPRAAVAKAPASDPAGASPPQAVRVGGTIPEPTKVQHVSPEYPEIARSARVQGIVILEATIDPRGRVSEVRVLRGVPLLNPAAIDAVRQWEYTPTLLNGVPVPVIMTVTVKFSLR